MSDAELIQAQAEESTSREIAREIIEAAHRGEPALDTRRLFMHKDAYEGVGNVREDSLDTISNRIDELAYMIAARVPKPELALASLEAVKNLCLE